jgi:hypothetical protein
MHGYTISLINLKPPLIGVLCYDNEPITADPNVRKSRTVVSCVIFDAKERQYALHAQEYTTAITNGELQTLYGKFAGKSDPTIKPTNNKNGGFLYKDYKLFKMIAQLTTGREVPQLHFEVIIKSLSSPQIITMHGAEKYSYQSPHVRTQQSQICKENI